MMPWDPKMQSRVCSIGNNVVKNSHLSRVFQALEEKTPLPTWPSGPEVAVDAWIPPQPFPRCAPCWEQAKKTVVFLMWWFCYCFGATKEDCGGGTIARMCPAWPHILMAGCVLGNTLKPRISRVCVLLLSLLCLERELSPLLKKKKQPTLRTPSPSGS